MPLASVLHPVLVRERDDKKVDATDLRIAQLLERCHIADVDSTASAVELPTSKIMRREVRLAPTEAVATQIAEAIIEKNIKKGWEKVG